MGAQQAHGRGADHAEGMKRFRRDRDGVAGAEAHRIGLVSRICRHEDLEAEARKAAIEVLQTAPECRAHVKRMLNQQYAAIDYETMFVSLMSETSEAREGMTAFMEKRAPNWIPADLPT